MTNESLSEWEQEHIHMLTSRQMGAWLGRRENRLLDEIRAEIEQEYCKIESDYDKGRNIGLRIATQIIDKYKAK